MKYAVIDVGSNSVRLMFHDGVKTLEKRVKTTRLAEAMGIERRLQTVAMDRTISAISVFLEQAKLENVDEIFIFATAAVRKATNQKEFLGKLKEKVGVDAQVVSGETEAKLGYMGALNGKDGGIIDVGGASTEITVVKNGKQIYTESLDLGAVSLKDACGQDGERVLDFVERKIKEYGIVPSAEFYAIGGTATTVAAMIMEMEVYDPNRVDGFVVERSDLERLTEKLFALSVENRKKLKGLQPERAEVIAGGTQILLSIMKMLKIEKFYVSEKDNLEGYLMLKRGLK